MIEHAIALLALNAAVIAGVMLAAWLISVVLSDVSGVRGKKEMRCQIRASIPCYGAVIVESSEQDTYSAVDQTSERAKVRIRQQIQRRQDHVVLARALARGVDVPTYLRSA